jgi:hypothetical protein
LPGGKYRANMYIVEPSQAKSEALHSLYEEYADFAVKNYFMPFFSMEQEFKSTGVYCPGDDDNLLLWSIIPYAGRQLHFWELNLVKHDDITISRKDGGNYAALATVHKEIDVSFDRFYYNGCGDMNRSNDHLSMFAWQLDTYWCGRQDGWRNNLDTDYAGLVHYISGNLPQNGANIDTYRRLIDKEYLVRADGGFQVNIVYCKDRQTGERLSQIIPSPNHSIREAAAKLDHAVYRINLAGQPEQAHKYVRYWSQNVFSSVEMRAYVLKNMVDNGLLKTPEPQRQKGISTILFINK